MSSQSVDVASSIHVGATFCMPSLARSNTYTQLATKLTMFDVTTYEVMWLTKLIISAIIQARDVWTNESDMYSCEIYSVALLKSSPKNWS